MLERISPRTIMEIVRSGESVGVVKKDILPAQRHCIKCGYISSQELCQACRLLSGLNSGETSAGITKSTKKQKIEGGCGSGGDGDGGCACSEKSVDF